MKSYSTGLAQYLKDTKNPDATGNGATGTARFNDDYRNICAMRDWPFLEANRALVSIANTQFLPLPYDTDLVREISVIPVGSTITYTPRLSPSSTHWDQLNLSQFSSDIPEWYFVFGGQLGIWPRPASSGNAINIRQKTRVIDLNRPDYTTGNIVTATTGSTAIVGSGTSWTTAMVGRWIQITMTDTANAGDGEWYEIAGINSSTSLTLVTAYGGGSITSGSAAYTIGQMPLLPEAFHATPWKYATALYWAGEEDERGSTFQTSHDNDIITLARSYSAATTSMVMDDGEDHDILNPNLTIEL